ncbi:putative glycoside hydrolase [Nocardioides sp.]|uniref:putative glycoside hydrolase n=1 Tax=Nocardioides sp. TaxID=35761 RepID=UPI00356885C5
MLVPSPRLIRAALTSALAGVVALGVAPGLPTLAASAAQAPAARAGAPAAQQRVALTWAPTYMSNDHDYSRREALRVARKFDLVAGMPIAFQEHQKAMRSANPDLTLLAYANATMAQTYEVGGLPEAAFAHTKSGARIKVPAWGTWLMESSNPQWRRAANRQCDDRSQRGGYDGCLVDMLTLGIFSQGLVTGIPVRPGTRKPYTQAQYRTQMSSLADHYRRASPNRIHVGNAIENAYRYWQSPVQSRPLAAGMPGAQMEDFMRGAFNPADSFPGGEDWKRNADVVRDLEAKNVTGLYTTKLWVGASKRQTRRWQAYAMATFLMGANGRSYFSFTRSRDAAGATGRNAPYAMPRQIGRPKGPMRKLANGAWVRSFANGKSVVNPTDRAVTVRLGGTHRALGGAKVRTLRLAPRTGNVVVKRGGSTGGATGGGGAGGEGTSTDSPSPDAPDTTAPTGSFTSTKGARTRLRLVGGARDDRAVATVRVAIRNERTKKWRQADGTWGDYQLLRTRVGSAGEQRTRWAKVLRLARGRYGVSLVVDDGAGNRNLDPRPWTVVRVR